MFSIYYTGVGACMQCCGDHCRGPASTANCLAGFPYGGCLSSCRSLRVQVCNRQQTGQRNLFTALRVTRISVPADGGSWHYGMACFAAQVGIHRMTGVYPVHAVATGAADLKGRPAVARVAAWVVFVFHEDDGSRV